MDLKLDAIGIVVTDIAKSIQFYQMLGLPFETNSEEQHVEAKLPSGLRVMLDTEEVVKSFAPDWKRPDGQYRASHVQVHVHTRPRGSTQPG